jgi:hypothetical protein
MTILKEIDNMVDTRQNSVDIVSKVTEDLSSILTREEKVIEAAAQTSINSPLKKGTRSKGVAHGVGCHVALVF